MKVNSHGIHKYQRRNLTRNKDKEPYFVYACVLPGCTSYIRCELALGKECLCNVCSLPFVLDRRSVIEKKPHCDNCIRRKPGTKKVRDRAAAIMEALGILEEKE